MSKFVRTLAIALVALCVVTSGSALAASNAHQGGPNGIRRYSGMSWSCTTAIRKA